MHEHCRKYAPDGIGYFNYLSDLVRQYGLKDFVRFKINVRFDRLPLISCASQRSTFIRYPGEPFGMSTVEGMSAGIIPVVPDIGGQTEFVPTKYQFHTFGQGVPSHNLTLLPLRQNESS